MSELEFKEVKTFEEIVFEDIAEMLGVSIEEVRKDFARFNAEVDRLTGEEGLEEEDALAILFDTWQFGE